MIVSDSEAKRMQHEEGCADEELCPDEIRRAQNGFALKLAGFFLIIFAAAGIAVFICSGVVAPAQKYQEANSLAEAGDYTGAEVLLEELGDYVDSKQKLSEVRQQKLLSCQVDDTVLFGGLNWIVLARDQDKALLVTSDIVEVRAYHDSFEETTWAECSLRAYLNGEFLFDRFSPAEVSRILDTTVVTEDNGKFGTEGGDATVDKLFLASEDEAGGLMSKDQRKASMSWWLRSPGQTSHYAETVYSYGDILNSDSSYSFGGRVGDVNYGVRPLLWLDCSGR